MRFLSFVLLFLLTALSCLSSGQQTPINVGKCTSMSWGGNCSSASAPICPASGSGNCTMIITDNALGQAIATPQGGSATNYICVQPGTTVVWQEGSAESFLVSFGSTTTPFPNIPVFSGNATNSPQGQIANPANSVPQCNEYVILHCGATTCTVGDPIVVVRGGSGLEKPQDHKKGTHSESDR